MNPTQALEVLNNAAAQARLSRNDHIAVQAAVEVLRVAITPPTSPAPATQDDANKDTTA